MFLDDLQWADAASLQLLEHAARPTPETRHLLLIGAYRDNEVGPSHPLTRALTQLEEAGVAMGRVRPRAARAARSREPGSRRPALRPEAAEPLARLVAQKTGGNPFFVGQFLKALREGGSSASTTSGSGGRSRWTPSRGPG